MIGENKFLMVKKLQKAGMTNADCIEIVGLSRDTVRRMWHVDTYEDYVRNCK